MVVKCVFPEDRNEYLAGIGEGMWVEPVGRPKAVAFGYIAVGILRNTSIGGNPNLVLGKKVVLEIRRTGGRPVWRSRMFMPLLPLNNKAKANRLLREHEILV